MNITMKPLVHNPNARSTFTGVSFSRCKLEVVNTGGSYFNECSFADQCVIHGDALIKFTECRGDDIHIDAVRVIKFSKSRFGSLTVTPTSKKAPEIRFEYGEIDVLDLRRIPACTVYFAHTRVGKIIDHPHNSSMIYEYVYNKTFSGYYCRKRY